MKYIGVIFPFSTFNINFLKTILIKKSIHCRNERLSKVETPQCNIYLSTEEVINSYS